MNNNSSRQPPPRKSLHRQNALTKSNLKHHLPSTKHCYILLAGPAESGKSTTLNKIFGQREISPVEREIGTNEILEFQCKNIRFIDTPGLGALNSLEWDTRIIATMKKYLDTHEDLRECIPSIVVIVARFDDPKLTSGSSTFAKSLKELHLLNARLFSTEYCNLVILLTHFMNERKSLREFPNEKVQGVRDLVRRYLNKSCHIILGDNEAEDWGLPKILFNKHASFKLPTGDIYPDNFISLLSEVMGRSKIVTDVFDNRSTAQVSLCHKINLIKGNSTRFHKTLVSVEWALAKN